jgi:rhodanese-related sulfurtransferase
VLQNLAAVDLYRYDQAWELDPTQALSQFVDSLSDTGAALLDLRKPQDFAAGHVPGALNLPLRSLSPSAPGPFSDAQVLESQWRELDGTFTLDRITAHDLPGKNVFVMCYGGDTARVATSVLRARGIAASNVKGGYAALRRDVPQLQLSQQARSLIKQDWLDLAGQQIQGKKEIDVFHNHSNVVVGPL